VGGLEKVHMTVQIQKGGSGAVTNASRLAASQASLILSQAGPPGRRDLDFVANRIVALEKSAPLTAASAKGEISARLSPVERGELERLSDAARTSSSKAEVNDILREATSFANSEAAATTGTKSATPVDRFAPQKGPEKLTRYMVDGLTRANINFVQNNGMVSVWMRADSSGTMIALTNSQSTTGATLVPQDYGRVATALNYLSANGEADYIRSMVFERDVPIITFSNYNGFFRPSQNAIYWNPTFALITTRSAGSGSVVNDNSSNNAMMSPAMVLLHEMDHAYQYNYNRAQYNIDVADPHGRYDNTEEFRVISGLELRVARDLGEPTRTNHGAHTPSNGWQNWRVSDPTRHVRGPVVD
jgi:hypothetical protein